MVTRAGLLGAFAACAFACALAPSALALAPGDISTVAGNGTACSSPPSGCGDGTAATLAELNDPQGVAPLPGGGYLVVDTGDNEIREVSPSGTISVVAGDGVSGYNGDGIPATSAELYGPRAVAPLPGGGFLIADFDNDRVREVSPSGIISTVAGNGTSGYSGNGGPATTAELSAPRSVAVLPGGGFLIVDHNNCAIREVSSTGTITTVAGQYPANCGYSGDGGPATSAELAEATDVATLPGGGFIFSDGPNDVIREVNSAGTITTVAGNGTNGDTGDGGAATSAELAQPRGVAGLVNGGFIFAEENGNRIRMVSPSGIISTVAGTGTAGFTGDGGPATSAEISGPEDVSLAPTGGFLIADTGNNRVRLVQGYGPSATINYPNLTDSLGFYFKGSKVPTSFSCSDDMTYALGLVACDDNNGTSTLSGGTGTLNTSTLGVHQYVVTAITYGGAIATAQYGYTVVLPFKVSIKAKRARVKNGRVKLTLRCTLGAPFSVCNGTLRLTVKVGKHKIVIAKGNYKIATGKKLTLKLRVSKKGRSLLAAAANHRLKVTAITTGVSHKLTLT